MGNLQPDTSLNVTVAILTANRDGLLKPLLHEIERQLGPQDEVIVLDTAESSTTEQLVSNFDRTRFRYKPHDSKPFDYAGARNELVRLASKDIVAFIDDDAFPFPHWLNRLRENLINFNAVGGPSVAAGSLPAQWDPEFNWCIGMSPPGVVFGDPGYYPNSGNLAIRTTFARKHPFQTLTFNYENEPIGREDAQWWMECRQRGENVALDYRQVVTHTVHPIRLTQNYLMRRAWRDGFADALRSPSLEKSMAAAVDFGRAIIGAFSRTRFIRIKRLHGQIMASFHSNCSLSKPKVFQHILRGMTLQTRLNLGDTIWPVIRRVNSKVSPVNELKSIYVSADCHMGDTVLLRRHIEALAITYNNTVIIVTATYPDLLTGLSPNVKVFSQSPSDTQLLKAINHANLAIVPYFHRGNDSFWKTHLANRTVTFDSDVGFKHRRNYYLAGKRVHKNFDLHEHENLARLFRVLPLKPTPPSGTAVVPDDVRSWLKKRLSDFNINAQYVVIHLGAGYQSKEWPVENWTEFLQQFMPQHQLPVVLIGGPEKQNEGQAVIKGLEKTGSIHNLTGETTITQLCAVISGAAFFVGPCSGPGHIAMMYNVPTFILYTASEPYRWGATENFSVHACSWALKQKLTAPELMGRPIDFRARLLKPHDIAARASHHFQNIMLPEKKPLSSG